MQIRIRLASPLRKELLGFVDANVRPEILSKLMERSDSQGVRRLSEQVGQELFDQVLFKNMKQAEKKFALLKQAWTRAINAEDKAHAAWINVRANTAVPPKEKARIWQAHQRTKTKLQAAEQARAQAKVELTKAESHWNKYHSAAKG